jgi:hypothetical protein
MQISYNKLKTFGECVLKYRLAYVEKMPRPPVASLAQYHAFAKRDGIVREDELLVAYAAIWSAERNPAVREREGQCTTIDGVLNQGFQ